jgi:hypothetical protein
VFYARGFGVHARGFVFHARGIAIRVAGVPLSGTQRDASLTTGN